MRKLILLTLLASLFLVGIAGAEVSLLVETANSCADGSGFYLDTYKMVGETVDLRRGGTDTCNITAGFMLDDKSGTGTETIWAEIWNWSGSGSPDSFLYNSTTTYANTAVGSQEWFNFTFTGVCLDSDYYFFGVGMSGTGNDVGLCRIGSNSYANGSLWYSTYGTPGEVSAKDASVRVYGIDKPAVATTVDSNWSYAYTEGADHLFDGGENDTTLNSSLATDGYTILNGGWTTGSGTVSYSNSVANKGSVSMSMGTSTNVRYELTENTSFTGAIEMDVYCATASTCSYTYYNYYNDDSDGNSRHGWDVASSQFRAKQDLTTATTCAGSVSDATWYHLVINYSGTNVTWYVDGTECRSETDTQSLGDQVFLYGASSAYNVDNFRVCNNDISDCGPPPAAPPGDSFDDIMVVNSTAPINYTSDVAAGDLGGWNNTGSAYITITASDTTPTVHFSTNGNANCAIANAQINYSSVVNPTTGANCSTTGTTTHTCTYPSALGQGTSDLFITCQSENDGYEMNATTWAAYPSNAFNVSIDTVGPSFANVTEVTTDPADYSLDLQRYNFTVDVTDTTGVSAVLLEGNFSRTGFLNYSVNSTNGNTRKFVIPDIVHAGNYSYRFFANDTNGVWNNTASFTYEVAIPSGSGGGGQGRLDGYCVQYVQIVNFTGTTENRSLTVECFNPNTNASFAFTNVTIDPDDKFGTSTALIKVSADSSNTTVFYNLSSRGSADGSLFNYSGAIITGNITQTTNKIQTYIPIDPPSAIALKLGDAAQVQLHPNISELLFTPNWSLMTPLNFSNPAVVAGNFSRNITQANITVVNQTVWSYNLTNNASGSKTIKVKKNETQDWYEIWVYGPNVTSTWQNVSGTYVVLATLEENASMQVNVTMHFYNATQQYVNWVLTENRAFWDFVFDWRLN